MEGKKIITDAVSHYGEAHQIIKAIEEMSELTKELSRFMEGLLEGTYVNHTDMRDRAKCLITEEMADVEVMLQQLKLIFNNEQAVNTVIDGKLARLQSRMDGDGK